MALVTQDEILQAVDDGIALMSKSEAREWIAALICELDIRFDGLREAADDGGKTGTLF